MTSLLSWKMFCFVACRRSWLCHNSSCLLLYHVASWACVLYDIVALLGDVLICCISQELAISLLFCFACYEHKRYIYVIVAILDVICAVGYVITTLFSHTLIFSDPITSPFPMLF